MYSSIYKKTKKKKSTTISQVNLLAYVYTRALRVHSTAKLITSLFSVWKAGSLSLSPFPSLSS